MAATFASDVPTAAALPHGRASVPPDQAPAATPSGTSSEMRRFSAGIRAIVALLCSLLLIYSESNISIAALGVLLGYGLWSAIVLWAEASGHTAHHALLHYWVDVAWTVLVMHLTTSGTMMMVVTLVQPVVLASIGYGVRHGVLLALAAAGGMLVDLGLRYAGGTDLPRADLVSAAAVLALVPLAALLSRPMSVLRQRLELVRELEDQLDPRRGLDAVALSMVDVLRRGTEADVVGLLLPTAAAAPATLATADDGAFRISPAVQARLEPVIAKLPRCPTTYVVPSWFGLSGGLRVHGLCVPRPEHAKALSELAVLLDMRMVIVVPLMRYERRHGCLVVGLRQPRVRLQEVAALADAAPELFRLIEQAALVDRLQEESTAHERVRIGRDLHDSAIQPYLGLKYAVEGVACRVDADNPARADIDALLELVNGEIGALREVISGLRIGEARGDNALIPAVRRQVRRFGLLFGIEVELACPEELNTSRALAGALFHMVNEAMNNVRKHSAARKVWITLAEHGERIELRVRDDAGTLQGQPQPDFEPRSLTERAAALGGTLAVRRPDGRNTELVISIPADAVAA